MVETAVTRDGDGDVIQTLDTTPVATINFGRTVTFPDTFGAKEECSVFIQVPLVEGTDEKALLAQLDNASAVAKSFVYTQLGLESEVQPNGVVTSPAQIGQPKTTKGGAPRGGKPSAGGGAAGKPKSRFVEMTDELKAQCWGDLASATVEDKGNYLSITAQDGETIYDNRTSKNSPNGPDFKWKDHGYALWLKDAPDWFDGPGTGI